jgi:hypothetical protein
MKRRDFITLLGEAVAAWPISARAQQAAKIPRVGSFARQQRSSRLFRGFYFSPASSRIGVSAARWYGHSLHLCTIMSGSNFGSVVFGKCRCHTPMLKQ